MTNGKGALQPSFYKDVQGKVSNQLNSQTRSHN